MVRRLAGYGNTVTGAGSTWINNLGVNIGNQARSTLTIGGRRRCHRRGLLVIANNAGSVGTLNIGAGAGDPAAAPGIAHLTTSVAFGALAPVRSTSITRPPTTSLRPRSAANGYCQCARGHHHADGRQQLQRGDEYQRGHVLQAGATNTFSPNSAVMIASGGTLRSQWLPIQTVPSVINAGLVNMGHGHGAGHGLDDDQLRGNRRH